MHFAHLTTPNRIHIISGTIWQRLEVCDRVPMQMLHEQFKYFASRSLLERTGLLQLRRLLHYLSVQGFRIVCQSRILLEYAPSEGPLCLLIDGNHPRRVKVNIPFAVAIPIVVIRRRMPGSERTLVVVSQVSSEGACRVPGA